MEEFSKANVINRLHRFFQLLLFIGVIVGVNLLGSRFFVRKDFSESNRLRLSAESKAYVRALSKPVDIIVTISADSPRHEEMILFRYVKELLKEYAYVDLKGRKPMIKVEFVDIYKQIHRAESLAREFGVDQPNLVLVKSGKRKRVLFPTDILEFKDFNPVKFKGEQAITSALIEVAEDKVPVIYFIRGHGEMSPDDVSAARGLSVLAQELKARNIELRSLDLTLREEVPEDADLIFLVDPLGPCLASEVEKLRNYLGEKSGRMVVLLGPGHNANLGNLFADWGISVDNMAILEQGENFQESTGRVLIRQFAEHPITQVLVGNQTPVVAGICRPVRKDPRAPLDESLNHISLMASSANSWGERSWRSADLPRFDPGVDLKGPVSLAVLAKRGAATELGIRIEGGRLLTIGAGDLFANQNLTAFGNQSLAFSVVNWMLDRNQLVSIQPKPITQYRLNLSKRDKYKILTAVFVPALLMGFLGLLMLVVRTR